MMTETTDATAYSESCKRIPLQDYRGLSLAYLQRLGPRGGGGEGVHPPWGFRGFKLSRTRAYRAKPQAKSSRVLVFRTEKRAPRQARRRSGAEPSRTEREHRYVTSSLSQVLAVL